MMNPVMFFCIFGTACFTALISAILYGMKLEERKTVIQGLDVDNTFLSKELKVANHRIGSDARTISNLKAQIEALKDKEPEVRLAYDSSTGRLWDKTTGFDLGNCKAVTINESVDNVTTAQIVIVLERNEE